LRAALATCRALSACGTCSKPFRWRAQNPHKIVDTSAPFLGYFRVRGKPLALQVAAKLHSGKNSMNLDRRLGFSLAILFVAVAGSALVASRASSAPPAQSAPTTAQEGQVDRGRYIVQNVAMCEECHTPRDGGGNLDEAHALQGAPIWIVSVHPRTDWANRAPALAGFVGFTEQQGEDILERGIGPSGLAIQPPMHIYHMSHADAQAVIAYLRSLPGAYSR
jgi:mono/diheme cytochrome c family protein